LTAFYPIDFEQHIDLFNRYFDLSARIPNFVFKPRVSHKLVIRDSGALHKMEVFDKLSSVYGDKELCSLVLEPEAAGVFVTDNKLLAYVVPFGIRFRETWEVKLHGFGESPYQLQKGWPWMTASLQCYIGSSELWYSYHDNHSFELDIFYVPNDCDTLDVFGTGSWTFSEIEKVFNSSHANVSIEEMQTFKKNYFK
jgi:hypothetical protein